MPTEMVNTIRETSASSSKIHNSTTNGTTTLLIETKAREGKVDHGLNSTSEKAEEADCLELTECYFVWAQRPTNETPLTELVTSEKGFVACGRTGTLPGKL